MSGAPADLGEALDALGIDAGTAARWWRELSRCSTNDQVELTAECHRLEVIIRHMSRGTLS